MGVNCLLFTKNSKEFLFLAIFFGDGLEYKGFCFHGKRAKRVKAPKQNFAKKIVWEEEKIAEKRAVLGYGENKGKSSTRFGTKRMGRDSEQRQGKTRRMKSPRVQGRQWLL